jgi:hypothetical protein
MRRILAITLLIAFGSPLLVPLLAATPDSPKYLAACCRKAGVHNCASAAKVPGAPVWQAPPCADFPAPTAPQRVDTTSLVTPHFPAFESVRELVELAPLQRLAETAAPAAHPKRGPPAPIA